MAKTMNHQAFEGCFQVSTVPVFKRTQVLSEYNIIEDIAFDQARKCLYSEFQMPNFGKHSVAFQFGAIWMERL